MILGYNDVPLKITVLGCGNSSGVPAIGNYWGKCDPAEPKNFRTRSSIVIESETTRLVIDTGPDFRQQMIRENIIRLDAALYTHSHGDHTHGIDELRILCARSDKERFKVFMDRVTYDEVSMRFAYLFDGGKIDLYPPVLDATVFEPEDWGKTYKIGDIEFKIFEQDHGTCKTVGYRFGEFAYSADILNLEPKAINALDGIKIWMVDAAGYRNPDNPVHATIQTVMRLNNMIRAKRVFLTSLSLAMDYKTLLNELPKVYTPSHDGMILQ